MEVAQTETSGTVILSLRCFFSYPLFRHSHMLDPGTSIHVKPVLVSSCVMLAADATWGLYNLLVAQFQVDNDK